MHWELEITLFIFLIITAIVSISVRNLVVATVSLSAFSFLSALIFVTMGAIDVGFTEAVVGAGVTGILFIIIIFNTTRRSED